MIKNNLITE